MEKILNLKSVNSLTKNRRCNLFSFLSSTKTNSEIYNKKKFSIINPNLQAKYKPLKNFEPDPEVTKFYKDYLNDDSTLPKSYYDNLHISKLDHITKLSKNEQEKGGIFSSLNSNVNKFMGMMELKDELKEVVKIINTKITVSKEAELQELSEYYFKMGGKMIRPYLLISVSKYMFECLHGESNDYFSSEIHTKYITPFAACVEVLHNASLLQDDIIDNSDQRRNLSTAHNIFGIRNTVFAANYIISKAANMLTELEIDHLNEIYSSMVYYLTYGEYQQSLKTFDLNNVESAFKVYMIKTYYKTASLLALGLRGIGIIYKLDEVKQQKLFNLGLHIGLVFQLVDDVIDVICDSSSTKKPTHKDLIEGVINSYILFEMQDEKKKGQSTLIMEMAQRKFKEEGDLEKILKYLENGKGIIKTQNLALDHVTECYRILDDPFFKNNTSKFTLYQCFNFLINRKY